jgi:hypothetical protein
MRHHCRLRRRRDRHGLPVYTTTPRTCGRSPKSHLIQEKWDFIENVAGVRDIKIKVTNLDIPLPAPPRSKLNHPQSRHVCRVRRLPHGTALSSCARKRSTRSRTTGSRSSAASSTRLSPGSKINLGILVDVAAKTCSRLRAVFELRYITTSTSGGRHAHRNSATLSESRSRPPLTSLPVLLFGDLLTPRLKTTLPASSTNARSRW